MANRIPSSLIWLVSMRAEIRGEFEKLQCEMSEYLSFYNNTVEKIENDLSVIEPGNPPIFN